MEYPNKEFILPNLRNRIADIIVIINDTYVFHLEAQMANDDMMILRVFEYGFYSAMSMWNTLGHLNFPEPIVIYLGDTTGVPEESILHISFGSQGHFDYHVKNFLYLAHSAKELNRRKMIILIPFQTLRLRNLLQWRNSENYNKDLDVEKIHRLQEEIRDDIINSIKLNHKLKNITTDDANQLLELSNLLYEHLCKDLKSLGGEKFMNPLLPGAIELPNDKYRFRIDELEREIKQYADENTRFADEITRFADENARFADENARLKERIAELESQLN